MFVQPCGLKGTLDCEWMWVFACFRGLARYPMDCSACCPAAGEHEKGEVREVKYVFHVYSK